MTDEPSIQAAWNECEDAGEQYRARIAEQEAEITRLRGVIAQLREDWRPKSQQEVAAMTAAQEVARLWGGRAEDFGLCYITMKQGQNLRDCKAALDRLVEAFGDG